MVVSKLNFSDKGKTSLASLDKEIGQRVLNKLKWLIQNFNDVPHLPLSGKFEGLYKLKIGDWRALYEINQNEKFITVHKVGHRSEIYK